MYLVKPALEIHISFSGYMGMCELFCLLVYEMDKGTWRGLLLKSN